MNLRQLSHALRESESPSKLSSILDKSVALGLGDNMEVDVEIQSHTIEIYRIASANTRDGQLVLTLQNKATACLAPDKCGIDVVTMGGRSCCDNLSSCG